MSQRIAAASELLLPADRRTHDEAKENVNAHNAGRDAGTVNGMRYEMLDFMEQCVERYIDLAGVPIETLKPVATPGLDDHSFNPEDWTESGKLAPIATRVIMKILYAARMYRFDLLHSVNALARDVTRWCRACDKKLHRLISYIHHTKHYVLEGGVGDTLKDCAIMLFTDADFAGNLRDSKSTTGIFMAMVGPNTFFPLGAISKTQSAVSHSSTEAEVIALDYAIRVEGLPALTFWENVVPLFWDNASPGGIQRYHRPLPRQNPGLASPENHCRTSSS